MIGKHMKGIDQKVNWNPEEHRGLKEKIVESKQGSDQNGRKKNWGRNLES